MDQIQIHPTVFADGSLVAEGIRGGGAILINNAGDRFTNEMGTRDVVSAAEIEQPTARCGSSTTRPSTTTTPQPASMRTRA